MKKLKQSLFSQSAVVFRTSIPTWAPPQPWINRDDLLPLQCLKVRWKSFKRPANELQSQTLLHILLHSCSILADKVVRQAFLPVWRQTLLVKTSLFEVINPSVHWKVWLFFSEVYAWQGIEREKKPLVRKPTLVNRLRKKIKLIPSLWCWPHALLLHSLTSHRGRVNSPLPVSHMRVRLMLTSNTLIYTECAADIFKYLVFMRNVTSQCL